MCDSFLHTNLQIISIFRSRGYVSIRSFLPCLPIKVAHYLLFHWEYVNWQATFKYIYIYTYTHTIRYHCKMWYRFTFLTGVFPLQFALRVVLLCERGQHKRKLYQFAMTSVARVFFFRISQNHLICKQHWSRHIRQCKY